MRVPTHHEQALARVNESTSTSLSSGFTASYANVPPRQLLDLVLMSRRTAELTFTGSDGTKGRIRCVNGRVENVAIDGACDLRYLDEVLDISSENAQVSFSPMHPSTLGGALVGEPVSHNRPMGLIKVEAERVGTSEVRRKPPTVDGHARGAALTALVVGLLLTAYILRMEFRPKARPLTTNSHWEFESKARKAFAEGSTARQIASVTEPLIPEPILDLVLEIEPPQANIWLDGTLVGQGQLNIPVDNLVVTHELRIEAKGFVPRHVTFLGTPPPRRVSLVPLPSSLKERRALRRRRRARRQRRQGTKKPVAASSAREQPSKRVEPEVEMIGDDFPSIELIESMNPEAEVAQ